MKNKFAQYFAIEARLKTQGYHGTRKGLIMEFTNDSKSGLRELSETEYEIFILWLLDTYPANLSEIRTEANNMRRKVIALFRKIGYNAHADADMERIYSWVLKYGYLKKHLNKYTNSELPKLVTQVELYFKSTLK